MQTEQPIKMFCTTSETEGEVGKVKLYLAKEPTQQRMILQIPYLSCMYSPKCFQTYNADLSKHR